MSRKIWTVLTVVLVVALIAATFVGCKDKNNGNDKTNVADYTVTLDYNYQGATATTLTVADGDAISEALLTNPTRTGYTFGGWYLDAGCQTPLTFDNGMSLVEVTNDITLYAKWVQEISLAAISAEYVGAAKSVGDAITAADFRVTATYTDGTTKVVTGVRLGIETVEKAGANVITLTYVENGVTKTATATVEGKAQSGEPTEPTLVGITAEYRGADLEVGTDVAKADVVVTASYSDRTTKAVTDFTIGTYDKTTAGTKTVTVTYEGKTATFQVTYVAQETPGEPTMVSVSFAYNGGQITVGDDVDVSMITATATYSDGTTKIVVVDTQYTLGAYDKTTAGTKTIDVYLSTEKMGTLQVTYVAQETPGEPTLVGIAAEYKGADLEVGTEVAKSDVTVTATYSDESTKAVIDFTIGTYDKTTAGTKTITITYEDKTATFQVTYVEPSVQTRVPVYFYNGNGWDTVNAYGFDLAGGKHLGKWGGAGMTNEEDGWFSVLAPAGTYYIIFNNGAAQSRIYAFEGETAYYAGGVAYASKEAFDNSRVTYVTEVGVTAYDMALEEGQYVAKGVEIDEDRATDVRVFVNDSTVQCAGYESKAGIYNIYLKYENEQWTAWFVDVTETPAWEASAEKRTVYFTNNQNDEAVYAYVWVGEGDDKHELTTWNDREAAKYEYTNDYSQKVYSYTFSVSYTNVVFTFGEEQTVDIDLTSLAEGKDAYYPEEKQEGKWTVAQWTHDAVVKELVSITATYTGGNVTVGSEVALSDVTVLGHYLVNGESVEEAIGACFVFDAYDNSAAGEVVVTVRYEQLTDTITVTFVEEEEEWTPNEEKRTVYFTNNKGWGALKAYIYNGAANKELSAWPGEDMEYVTENEMGETVYSVTFSVSYDTIVFNSGDVQTVDVALSDLDGDNNAYYIAGDSAGESGWAVGQWKYVAPTPKTLVSIAAEYTGSDVTVGKSVSKDDIAVTATYSDESTAEVTDFAIGEYDNTAAGNVIITITYQEKTATITVTFVEEEEEWTASETTRTIYFTKPNDWAKACAYVWAVDGKGETHAEAAWGTKQMTYVEDNQYGEKIYSYTFSVSYTCIIFLNGNEGNANQTVNIDLTEIGEGNDQYYLTVQVDEEGADQCKWLAADTKYVAYVPKTLDHITAVYGGEDIEVDGEIALSDVTVTAFYSDETSEVVTEDITLDYDSSEVAENVTVTVTYGGKTTTFKINVVAATPEWTASETTRTVYFTNNKGWGALKAYIYNGAANKELSAWPGEDMEYVTENEMGETVYSVTFSVSYDTIVFNSGDVQTVDVALSDLEGDNNAYYIAGDSANDAGKWAVGQWKYVAPTPKTLVSIAAEYTGSEMTVGKSVSKDDITVTATYSDESTAEVTDFAIGEYDNTAAGNVIITITYQEKTATITVVFVEEEEELTRTVYFTDNFKWGSANGGKIYAYVFKGKTPYTDWPGELMTYVENNSDEDAVYGYTFSTEYDTIIFSNGDGTQTIDITLGEDNAYYCSGWSDGSVTVGTWNRA